MLVIAPRDWCFVQTQVARLSERHEVRVVHPWVTRGPRFWVAACAIVQGLCSFPINSAEEPFEVMHSYSAWPSGIIGALFAWRYAMPHVVHEHLSPAARLLNLPFAARVLGWADRVVVPSAWQARQLFVVSSRHSHIIRNPVVVPDAVAQMPNSMGATRIVCAGRLERRKGFHRAIEAMRDLPGNWVLYIIGSGPEERALRFQARAVGAIVIFLPPMAHDALMRWLASANVVVCPSEDESFGLVAAEARALGTAVVASPVGAHADYASELIGPSRSLAEAIVSAANAAPPKLDRRLLGDDFADSMGYVYDVPKAEEVCV